MENGPFIDGFPIKTSIYKGFSMAMLNNQMVNLQLVWGFPWNQLGFMGGFWGTRVPPAGQCDAPTGAVAHEGDTKWGHQGKTKRRWHDAMKTYGILPVM